MSKITSIVLFYFLLPALLATAAPCQVFAQVRPATVVVSVDRGCILLLCGSVSNPPYAVDGDANTAASISPSAALSTAALRVGWATPVPAGAQITVWISFTSGSGLTLAMANNTTIKTYAANGVAALQTVPLSLTAIDANVMAITFVAGAGFQELELRTGSLLNTNAMYAVNLFDVTASTTPLPVELTTFTGKSRAAAVELSWATASETNSAYFVVERATEAQDQYRPLSKVAGAGTSTRPLTYGFVDAQPVELGYYRLRQVDLHGISTYSPVVAVQSTPALVLLAYPNPSTGLLTVTGPPHTRFTIVNRLGQVVQRGETGLAKACKVDLRGLPNSVYFLREEATGAVVKIATAGSDAP